MEEEEEFVKIRLRHQEISEVPCKKVHILVKIIYFCWVPIKLERAKKWNAMKQNAVKQTDQIEMQRKETEQK